MLTQHPDAGNILVSGLIIGGNMALLVNERKVRFYDGDKFVFYRVDKGLWRFAADESDST